MRNLVEFAAMEKNKCEKIVPAKFREEIPNSGVILPNQKYLTPRLPKEDVSDIKNFFPFEYPAPIIEKIHHEFIFIPSKEHPKKITMVCKGGERFSFILKHETLIKGGKESLDVRKESRAIDFANFVNEIFRTEKETKDKNFEMKTFAINSLSHNVNLVEWVEGTQTIGGIVKKLWLSHEIRADRPDISQLFPETKIQALGTHSLRSWNHFKLTPPVLHEYFLEKSDQNKWFEKFLHYNKSLAAWAFYCFLLGVGDRHSDNSLIEEETGRLVNIDFDCIFGKGKTLRIPEIVDFRLTRNMERPLGIFRSFGLFSYYFQVIGKVLHRNTDNILGALDSFIHDPLIDKNISAKSLENMQLIREKLQLFSPNQNIEENVSKIISSNRSGGALKKMFIGWLPHM